MKLSITHKQEQRTKNKNKNKNTHTHTHTHTHTDTAHTDTNTHSERTVSDGCERDDGPPHALGDVVELVAKRAVALRVEDCGRIHDDHGEEYTDEHHEVLTDAKPSNNNAHT